MRRNSRLAVSLLIVFLNLSVIVSAQATRYTVQIEASPSLAAAQEVVKQLKTSGLDAYIVKSEVSGKGTFYRVRVGKFPNQNEARKYGSDLQKQGVVREFFIAQYEQPLGDVAQAKPPVVNTPIKPVEGPIAKAPVKEPLKEPAKEPVKEPVKEPQKEPQKEIVKEQAPPKTVTKEPDVVAANTSTSPAPPGSTPAGPTSTPVSGPGVPPNNPGAVNANPPPISTTPVAAANVNFIKFQDPLIGYSFDRPQYWEGGPLDPKDAQDQKVNAGALFKSYQDSAFINAIWNTLDKANSPDKDNDLIVELILKSMGSGDGTQQMTETSRKVVSENGLIKTFLELKATFKAQGQEGPLDFLGRAVIVRANKGILLVVAFYAKTGPTYMPELADKIIATVRTPE